MPNQHAKMPLIIEDDASRHLEKLSPEQRRPKYGMNGLPQTGPSFTEEEQEATKAIYSPAVPDDKTASETPEHP